MTLRKPSTLYKIGLATLLVGLVAAAAFVFLMPENDAPTPEPDSLEPAPPLADWADGDAARTATIEVDPARGPQLFIGDNPALQLTPTHPALSFSTWQVLRSDSTTQIIGRGEGTDTFEGSTIRAVWTFAAGNPHAHLALQLKNVPASRLGADISLRLAFPAGDISLKAPAPMLPARDALWRAETSALSVSNWRGDGLDSSESTLTLNFWEPARHPGYSACAGASSGLKVSLEASLILRVGDAPQAFGWPYPGGAEAALAPVFGMPAHHDDPLLAEAAAPDARRWILRAHTLIYGHSDPDDPRYGNGGLLGNDLGATIVVPGVFAEDPAVRELAGALKQTRVELAARDIGTDRPEAFAPTSSVFPAADCAKLVALATTESPAAIIMEDDAATPPVGSIAPTPGDLAASVIPEQLDGQLKSLLRQGFEPDALKPLLDSHQTRVFTSPFVATRNPLIGAAHQSLLVPERDGHWTLAENLGGALANLGMWRETTPLLVSSVGALARHADTLRHIQWWWDEAGGLRVHNPTKKTLAGFTLAIPGKVTASAKNPGVASRTISPAFGARAGEVTTLLWWDLAPGTSALSITREDAPLEKATGLIWRIAGP